MLRQAFNILTKAAVLFTALQGTQRQVRLTTTAALLDAALVSPLLEPVTTLRFEQEIQCPVIAEEDSEGMDPTGKGFRKQFFKLYERTCWGFFAVGHALVDLLLLCYSQGFRRWPPRRQCTPAQ